MKVLGICGSPRKGGNTEMMLEESLKAASKAGAQTELYVVHDKNIAGCDGCHSCSKTGKCKINDDMQPLYAKMLAADALLLGSPVYFNSVTAQAKAVMDRAFCFLFHHDLKGKAAGSVLALRRVGASQTRSQINTWFISQGMIPLRGAIGYGAKIGEVKTGTGAGIGSTAMEEAAALGIEAVEMINRLS